MSSDDAAELALPRSSAPQVWEATVSETSFYWYDLINDPKVPDFHDPIGRYQRRMQFALDATMEKRLMFMLVARPRLRFDPKRSTSWGFFSLKLTIPILIGGEERKSTITVELKPPFEATFKKPLIQLYDKYMTLNWGSMTETFTIHDLMQRHDTGLHYPSKVQYVGQTRDPAGRLAKGRLMAVSNLCDSNAPVYDTLLLVQNFNVAVETETKEFAEQASQRSQMEVLEAALIRYFEGPDARSAQEHRLRRERLRSLHEAYQIEQLTIDLGFQESNDFYDLESAVVEKSRRHLFACSFTEGVIAVERLPEQGRPLVSLDS